MIGMCGGTPGLPDNLPDTGICCYGSAVYGPHRCTCWEPVFDLAQQAPRPGMPQVPVPCKLCGDCAYRPNSPERRGQPGAAADQDLLDKLVYTSQPFYCHTGIRRAVEYRHPSGLVVPAGPGDYQPVVAPAAAGGSPIPYQADGSPAFFCAGWLLLTARADRKALRDRNEQARGAGNPDSCRPASPSDALAAPCSPELAGWHAAFRDFRFPDPNQACLCRSGHPH